ncbi:MAG: hypothetical protein Q7J45_00420 [bacterium]|nr:hypothetical protein [bacterium]
MSERPPHIKLAPTDEEVQDQVREGLKMSPEEKENARLEYLEVLQKQPTITLTPEEMREIEEKKNREERWAA